MSNETHDQKEFERLLGSLLNSSISLAAANRLEQLMRSHPLRIQRYVDLVEIDVILEAESVFAVDNFRLPDGKSQTNQSEEIITDLQKTPSVLPLPELQNNASNADKAFTFDLRGLFLSTRVAAALVVFVTYLCWWILFSQPDFYIAFEDNVEYELDSTIYSTGDSVRTEDNITLKSGLLGIHAKSGVHLIAEGPCCIRLLEDGNFALDRGKIRARVFENTNDFSIYCPGIKVTDLGTEFGVHVSNSGLVTTEVYEGKVKMEIMGDTETQPIEISGGWGSVGGANEYGKLEPYKMGSFEPIDWCSPTQASTTAILKTSPDIYQNFDYLTEKISKSATNSSIYPASLQGDATLINLGSFNSVGDEAKALKLGGNGFAEIPIGFAAVEETGAYTFSCWIKAYELKNQSIFLVTNHLGPDQRVGAQLRIRSDGKLEHHLFSPTLSWGENPERQLQTAIDYLSINTWHHVAISADTRGDMILYLDGKIIAEPIRVNNRISASYPRILIGCGAHKLNYDAFKGILDDFAFYNRQLSRDEIADLYHASKPCYEAEP